MLAESTSAAHSVGFGYPALAPKPDERCGDHLTTDDAAPQGGGVDAPARISPAAKLLGVGLLAIPGLCTALVLWGPSIFRETFFAGFDILKAAHSFLFRISVDCLAHPNSR